MVDEDRGPVVVCISREGEISDTLNLQVSTSELDPIQAKGGRSCYYSRSALIVPYGPPQPVMIFCRLVECLFSSDLISTGAASLFLLSTMMSMKGFQKTLRSS